MTHLDTMLREYYSQLHEDGVVGLDVLMALAQAGVIVDELPEDGFQSRHRDFDPDNWFINRGA